MPVKKVKKPVVADVEVEKNKTQVSHQTIPVGTVSDTGPMANVGFSAAYTKNLGNYESLKVTVTLHMPVAVELSGNFDTEAALDKEFKRVQQWVDDKINSVLDELNE